MATEVSRRSQGDAVSINSATLRSMRTIKTASTMRGHFESFRPVLTPRPPKLHPFLIPFSPLAHAMLAFAL